MRFSRVMGLIYGLFLLTSMSQAEGASIPGESVSLQNARLLVQKLNSIKTLKASFRSSHPAGLGDPTIEKQTGCLVLSRPDRFKWITGQTPCDLTDFSKMDDNDELIISSDSKSYWHYQPSLLLVTKKKLVFSRMPLLQLLISSDLTAKQLSGRYKITIKNEKGGIERFTLMSHVKNNDHVQFEKLNIVFNSDGQPSTFDWVNQSQQKATFALFNEQTNIRLPTDMFVFDHSNLSDVEIDDETVQRHA